MKQKDFKRPKSAVSLRYNSTRDMAPKITAKGKGLVAENIVALAKEHNIPIKEDPDLVEVLSQVEVNQEIPPTVYHVVAELLAFVYQINKDYPKTSRPS
jgi:flagellar biosynthesis protein